MPTEQSSDSKFEIGHVLFIDIVGYSNLLIEEQKERLGDLERAARGLFRAVTKDQCHPVARRQPNELFVGRVAHLGCPEHDFR